MDTVASNGFVVTGRGAAEVFLIGGGGGGGDGNSGGGAGGAGALIIGNISLVPGQYRIAVGLGGGPTYGDHEGACGHDTFVIFPNGHRITAVGGAGGSGYNNPSQCTAKSGGGGAGPTGRNRGSPVPKNDWPGVPGYSSDSVAYVNVTEHRHNVSVQDGLQ